MELNGERKKINLWTNNYIVLLAQIWSLSFVKFWDLNPIADTLQTIV